MQAFFVLSIGQGMVFSFRLFYIKIPRLVNSILFGANYACVEFLFVLKAFKDGFRMAVFANLWKLTIWDSPKHLMQNAFFGVVKPVIY